MRRIFILVLLAILLATAGGWLLTVRMEREAPSVKFSEEVRFISRETPLEFEVEDKRTGLRHIKVWLHQGQDIKDVFYEEFQNPDWLGRGGEHHRRIKINLSNEKLKLDQGEATLVLAVKDQSLWKFQGNVTLLKLPVMVDTIPPGIDILSTAHNVKNGGSGMVAYRLSEKAGPTGVEVGDSFFPGYPEKSGGPGAYVAYFSLPLDARADIKIFLRAADEAGNTVRRYFPVRVMIRKLRRDRINITDGFLEKKMPDFQSRVDDSIEGLLDTFLDVNRNWRSRDHLTLRRLTVDGSPDRIWSGPFLQMKNSQNMADFAEDRSYVYKGRVIDHQLHLGLDLASTAGAPVPAGNDGLVVMTGELGIYGQTVLLDHGQGLFSLYAHLSGISVNKGEAVKRGQTIGSTGQTGLAGGDHLHYSLILSGEFIRPLEWMDPHWIADNIQNKLDLLTSRNEQ